MPHENETQRENQNTMCSVNRSIRGRVVLILMSFVTLARDSSPTAIKLSSPVSALSFLTRRRRMTLPLVSGRNITMTRSQNKLTIN
jgi:hypothetical protein